MKQIIRRLGCSNWIWLGVDLWGGSKGWSYLVGLTEIDVITVATSYELILIYFYSYIVYDNISNEDAFQIIRVEVKVTDAIIRKKNFVVALVPLRSDQF